jgi:16S rRNA (adenine1518-N6/adenine1519-N6)-dimethyltransferase
VDTGLADIVRRHGLDARKSLGQHFLLDAGLCARIARAAGDLGGVHVAEVGPGPGGLTRALLARDPASVTAIELDARALPALAEIGDPRLTVIQADALQVDLTAMLPAPRAVVANLPYNVGTPLLLGWLRQAGAFRSLTLMFQEEVAQRITAPPDGDAYGRLSVIAQWTCAANIALSLPPGAFSPPPRVWSAVVHLVPHANQPPPALFAAMERVTAAAFGQRRKMLRQSLKKLGGQALLDRAAIAGERRAETLSVAEFARLAALI